jgi:hypothetical protein
MASRLTSGRTQTFGLKEKAIRLRIFPDAANPPTFTSQGGVASVVLQATGLFRVTLQDAYYSCVEKQATYSAAANNVDLYPQFQGMSNLGTSTPVTVDVALKTGATNTNAAAAGANNHIDVTLVFEDSSG